MSLAGGVAVIAALVVGLLNARSDSIGLAARSEIITSITGVVLEDGVGRPVAGAVVRVQVDGEAVAYATTDSAGWYRIEGEFRTGRPNEYVEGFAVGFLPEFQRLELGCRSTVSLPGQKVRCDKRVDLFMGRFERIPQTRPVCELAGRVRDPAGSLLAGALIMVEGTDIGAVSGSDGQYTLSHVQAGFHVITASLIGRYRHEKLVYVGCAQDTGPPPITFQMFIQMIELHELTPRRPGTD
jgi:hypothetical protein